MQVDDFPVNVSQLAPALERCARSQCRGFGEVITGIWTLLCRETGHHLQGVRWPSARLYTAAELSVQLVEEWGIEGSGCRERSSGRWSIVSLT